MARKPRINHFVRPFSSAPPLPAQPRIDIELIELIEIDKNLLWDELNIQKKELYVKKRFYLSLPKIPTFCPHGSGYPKCGLSSYLSSKNLKRRLYSHLREEFVKHFKAN
jgi:hypothetical protein